MAKVFCFRTKEEIIPKPAPGDTEVRSYVNPRMKLESQDGGVWLYVSGRTHLGADPFLLIRQEPGTRASYHVRGIYGFGGMGYNGTISTRKLVNGLNRLGFRLDAKTLRAMVLKAPVRGRLGQDHRLQDEERNR